MGVPDDKHVVTERSSFVNRSGSTARGKELPWAAQLPTGLTSPPRAAIIYAVMLAELRIADLAIIDRLDLKFAPGFVVFTGETGAGKSIIIDAVALLLGGRGDPTLVRAGASAARVEGTFRLTAATAITELLAREELLEDARDELTLCRELKREGRSVARVNGRLVSLGLLRALGELLVDVHGQSEHLSLLRPREHLILLDRFANLDDEREAVARAVRELAALRKELADLRQHERDRERQLDVLKFQVAEIVAAKLSPDEAESLTEERTRLANAEKLATLVKEALDALDGGEEARSAGDQLSLAARAVGALAAIDATRAEQQATANVLVEQLHQLAGELRDYRDRFEFNPARLELVDDRLHLLRGLQRKYGASLDEVLAFGERAQQELETLERSTERIGELEAQELATLRQIGEVGTRLSDARRAAARQLAKGIERELKELRMDGAKFGVAQEWSDDATGAFAAGRRLSFDASGLDRVEFLIAPNPGEGLKPLVKIASGGETARLMLALKGVLARADRTPTLIFDEIDQGIGGRVGATVGAKLWRLATAHQVLCITHLPSLAAWGDQHFRVEKLVDGKRTTTQVTELDQNEQVSELALMLGVTGARAQQGARELLQSVRQEKRE